MSSRIPPNLHILKHNSNMILSIPTDSRNVLPPQCSLHIIWLSAFLFIRNIDITIKLRTPAIPYWCQKSIVSLYPSMINLKLSSKPKRDKVLKIILLVNIGYCKMKTIFLHSGTLIIITLGILFCFQKAESKFHHIQDT
uniref:Uncharacterized protein n=1 Tax=Cacopsylla melanoneura TaxID=428564 RepID=A0A8D8YZT5_9HEMI